MRKEVGIGEEARATTLRCSWEKCLSCLAMLCTPLSFRLCCDISASQAYQRDVCLIHGKSCLQSGPTSLPISSSSHDLEKERNYLMLDLWQHSLITPDIADAYDLSLSQRNFPNPPNTSNRYKKVSHFPRPETHHPHSYHSPHPQIKKINSNSLTNQMCRTAHRTFAVCGHVDMKTYFYLNHCSLFQQELNRINQTRHFDRYTIPFGGADCPNKRIVRISARPGCCDRCWRQRQLRQAQEYRLEEGWDHMGSYGSYS